MIHYVDYKIIRTYSGRIPIDAHDTRDAETKVKGMMPSDLQTMASTSMSEVSAKSEPPIDPRQLTLFMVEEDDGN
jgi:hypothetical protein